jgi:hypothetical protein
MRETVTKANYANAKGSRRTQIPIFATFTDGNK